MDPVVVVDGSVKSPQDLYPIVLHVSVCRYIMLLPLSRGCGIYGGF